MAYTLYYNPANDALVAERSSHSNSNLVPLFNSYDEKGYNHNKPTVEVEHTGFAFTIETNFGYSGRSHLRFKAVYKGHPLYSYPSMSDFAGNGGPSVYFCVEPEASNWSELFNMLCYVYKNRDNWNINKCLEWLEQRAQNDIVGDPVIMARSLQGLFSSFETTHFGTCNPIMVLTEQLCSRELPIYSKYLLENNCTSENIVYRTIESIFKFLVSIGRLDIFLKAIQDK